MAKLESILRSTNLPTLPNVAVQLLNLTTDEEAGPMDYARIIRSDPAIAVKLVQAANSSYYGLAAEVTTVESAVSMLGVTAAASLSLSFSLVSENHPGQNYRLQFTDFWSRSLLQAVTAETISERFDIGIPAEMFMAGLLCDIGILAHLCVDPEPYSKVLAAAKQSGNLGELEREQFGFDHAELGASLLDLWRMPRFLVETTRRHANDNDAQVPARVTDAPPRVHETIRFASDFGEYLQGGGEAELMLQLEHRAARLWKLESAELHELLESIRTATDEIASPMSIDTDNLPRPAELLSAANQHLVKIALREHAAATQTVRKSAELERECACLRARYSELNREHGLDALTQICNRGEFNRAYPLHLDRCVTLGQPLCLLFIDLDRFKRLNDTYGHRFGDEVLKQVAATISTQVRDSDFVARYGGEEIVVVLPNCQSSAAQRVAERIRSEIESIRPKADGVPVDIAVSIGICAVDLKGQQVAVSAELAENVLECADEAMYASKRAGGNQVTMAHYGEASGSPEIVTS